VGFAFPLLRLLLVLPVLSIVTALSAAESPAVYPDPRWRAVTSAEAGLNAKQLEAARDYALTGEGSGMIICGGELVLDWGDRKQRYDLKSSTKSLGSICLGLAIGDGKVKLDDLAIKYQPTLGVPPEKNKATGWIDKITLYHLATQTAGFEKPGGYGKLLFAPGTKWRYSDAGPNWLAECLTLAYQRDLNDLMFERVFTPIGITPEDLVWRKNQYREKELNGVARREFGAGINADVEAMSRIGYLMLRGGKWKDKQLLPAEFVARCGVPQKEVAGLQTADDPDHAGSPPHYGLLWWNNGDGTLKDVPRDAYWSWGLYDSLIVVIPSLDIVAVRAGKSWKREAGAGHYEVLRGFLEPIAKSAGGTAKATGSAKPQAAGDASPYPASPVIKRVEWAAASSVIRLASGSDNWPMTWADDNHLYTAYGDGWGFQHEKGDPKLSLGVARVAGFPPDMKGFDIPSPSIEAVGNDFKGEKASGILCVDGVLYMWLRNAGNSRLAWSNDHGETWKRAEWKFSESFGCPTFMNAGRNYAEAQDDFVYVYSFDSNDAYTPSDRMVMARVPKTKIRDRAAYEFFGGSINDQAVWTDKIALRGDVFRNNGRCFRSNITWSPAIKRYLWVQRIPPLGEKRPKLEHNGLAIFDAPAPWGPWTTAYYAAEWDILPGDSAVLPSKWISADGTSAYLVFAGDDSFAVRGVRFEIASDAPKHLSK
jgi:CubicO group peptidase (beta-lactamase class C family)